MAFLRLLTQSLWQFVQALLLLAAAALGLVLLLIALMFAGAYLRRDISRVDGAKLDIQIMRGALRLYEARHHRYPSTREGLQPLVDARTLDSLPLDPWGNPYRYTFEGGAVELRSLARDGAPGGSGLDEDIVLRIWRCPVSFADEDIRFSDLPSLREDAGS